MNTTEQDNLPSLFYGFHVSIISLQLPGEDNVTRKIWKICVNILIFKVLQRNLKIQFLNSEKDKKKNLNAVLMSCWSRTTCNKHSMEHSR